MAIIIFPKDQSGANFELHELGDITSDSNPRERVSRDIFDPELFEEIRELFGEDRTRQALEELSSCLKDNFPDLPPEDLDREQVFRRAHYLVARAGLMGFTALRDRCDDLQHACASGRPFDKEYIKALESTMATRNAIAYLQV